MSFEVDLALTRGDRRITIRFSGASGLTALFGASGAGKTSVLDAIAGLLRPASGRIVASGETLFDHEAGIDLPPERRGCGYVFQDNRLFPHLNAADNLLFGHRLRSRAAPAPGLPPGPDPAPGHRCIIAPGDAIDLLGIGHVLHRMPRTLSGGEAQRVAIGRALLSTNRWPRSTCGAATRSCA